MEAINPVVTSLNLSRGWLISAARFMKCGKIEQVSTEFIKAVFGEHALIGKLIVVRLS